MEFIIITKSNKVTTVTLNRPDKRNAMHGPLIRELQYALQQIAGDDSRVLIINGNGDNFCAGGDIAWMQEIATGSDDKNYEDAQSLADLLYQLYVFPKPTIVTAKGATLGGGLGLLTAADIAIASKDAVFGLPEVKIGLTPSMISPYVISAIGERAAHYYFITGERFDADEAYRLGLIHSVCEVDALMQTGLSVAESILQNSPKALVEAKQLLKRVSKMKISEELAQKTAEHLAELRSTAEAQEGLRAFIEKRKPNW